MNVSDFDYVLPARLIAQHPLEDRSASRLLVLHKLTGQIEHRSFTDLLEYLSCQDLLVMNNTRVSALRIFGERSSGGQIEALILSRIEGAKYIALLRPSKKLNLQESLYFEGGMAANVVEDLGGGRKVIEFQEPHPAIRLQEIGKVPLPPYIHATLENPERYQTVYGCEPGSAAAPTSGLHFTMSFLEAIKRYGVNTATVTLDVGLDTFRPMTSETTEGHVMHGELCRVPNETAEAVSKCSGKIFAVGTTTTRTLETFASDKKTLNTGERNTTLFITPGYQFKVVDALLTNFHMPRTTMLMMVGALAGRDHLMRAYSEAVVENYRFLSFGDAMLIV